MSAYYNQNSGKQTPKNATNEGQVPIDGFQQLLEMLRVADPAFRDSLLKRIAARDRNLARELVQDLGI